MQRQVEACCTLDEYQVHICPASHAHTQRGPAIVQRKRPKPAPHHETQPFFHSLSLPRSSLKMAESEREPPATSIRSSLDAFLSSNPPPAPPFKHGLLSYVTQPTPLLRPIPWIPAVEEVDTRLELARQLRYNLRRTIGETTMEFTAIQLSVLLLIPIDILRQFVQGTSEGAPPPGGGYARDIIWISLQGLQDAVKYCRFSPIFKKFF